MARTPLPLRRRALGAMRSRATTLAGLVAAGLALSACGASKPVQPPGKPPSPTSITTQNPGGDASDPERAALERLADQPFGARTDEFRTLRVPVPDWPHWDRVTVFGHPTRLNVRYGDERYALGTVLYRPIDGVSSPERCLQKFNADADLVAKAYGVRIQRGATLRQPYRFQGEERELVVQVQDGSIDSVLAQEDYVGAVVSYPSWPGTCLVYGFAVMSTNHPELAERVRDRFIDDGADRLRWERKVRKAPPFDTK